MLNPDQSTNRFNAHINYADGPTFGNTYWDFGQVSGGGRLQVSAPSNSVNAWVHYALVASQSGTAMRIYANGNLIASKTGMSPFVRGSFELRIGGPGFPYNGRLDEFRIWNTARSQAQIQASLGAPLTGNETNLLLYYRFDSASGTVATNSATLTGTAYNGTLVNSPTWVASTAPSTVVLNTNDAGAYSLRSAISNAPAGSTITFDPSLSGKTILLTNGEITLNKNLTIDASALANGIVINGNNASRIFNVAASTTNVLTALTLTNGNADGSGGGGIGNSGTLTLNRCTLTGNHANTPGNGGGAISSSGPLTLNQCTIVGNQATGSGGVGGGIYNYFSILNVNQSTITSNTAVSGGGIYKQNGTMNLTNSIICNNTALFNPNISGSSSSSNNLVDVNALLAPLGNYGGPTPTMPPLPGSPAIDAGSDSAASQFTTDQRGFARKVGAHVDIGAVEVSPTDFNRVVTTAADSGTGSLRQVIADANPGSTITFSNTLSGQTILLISGELLLNKNLTIDGSSLTNAVQLNGNHASRIFSVNSGTTNVLNSLTITNGYSSGTFPNYNGGGIYNAGSLTVNNCTLAGNTNRGASVGGGIYNNSGSLTVNQSTLSGNHSDGYGGGIKNDGTLTVNQSTVSGNSASGTPGASGGGIANYTGTLNLTNSIVAGNTATVIADIAGTITTSGGVNLTNGTPLLAPLGNYGGPTQTMPPLPGSPAIDGCTNSAPAFATDQRGLPRVVGAFADIGAVEVNWPTNVYVDPAKTWIGFMNVFNLPANGGGYQFGSSWGTADLNAFFTGPTLTLTPNTSINRDVPNDPYWWVGGAGGAPNKNMDANFYVQNDALAGGQTVIFSAYCKSNTLVAPYISVAFIKDFVPDYSSFIQTNVAVVTGQPFSIALTTSAGHYIQYGFETVGPNARLANVAALGKVIINSNAPVVIVASTPPVLTNVVVLGNGSFRFNFTSTPGASLTVWGSTNVALPFAQWSNLGAPVESPAGTFQFTDPQAPNKPTRFYRVTSP